jgi:predicted nucleotidyltransferase
VSNILDFREATMLEEILFSTNSQKVLSFLIRNADSEYYDREIAKLTNVSRAGTNFALRHLAESGLIMRQKKGRMYFYKATTNEVVIRYLKILQNIVSLQPLIKKLKKLSLKVILYGSAAQGENREESDTDIFILTRDHKEVEKIIFKDNLRRKIQYVVYAPNDFVKSKKINPNFHKEITKGIVLWEERGI